MGKSVHVFPVHTLPGDNARLYPSLWHFDELWALVGGIGA